MWERLTEAESAVDCRPPFSFYFEVVRAQWKAAASDPRSLHRVCTLARKMRAQTLVTESALDRPDLIEELDDLDAALGPGGAAEARKISFLDVETDLARLDEVPEDGLIGQAIIVNYKRPGEDTFTLSYIYEAIIRVPRLNRTDPELLNNYYHTRRNFTLRVAAREFVVNGVYYCQQNGVTHVCAHAALRMALNTVSPGADLVSNKQIAKLLGVDPAEVFVDNIERVLAQRQLEPYVWNAEGTPPIDYLRILYSIVESGYPALLVFSTADDEEDHVITVWGHTLNSDEWHPEAQALYAGPESARYYPSSAWADHFLIHDDNLGPYYCLARDALSTRPVGPRFVVGLFPRRIDVSPALAEGIATSKLRVLIPTLGPYGQGAWWRYMIDTRPIYVLRTLFLDKQSYLTHLRGVN